MVFWLRYLISAISAQGYFPSVLTTLTYFPWAILTTMENEIEVLKACRENRIWALKYIVLEYSERLEDLAFLILNDRKKANQIVTETLDKAWQNNFKDCQEPSIEIFLDEQVRLACIKVRSNIV
jgi:hypothetical protein